MQKIIRSIGLFSLAFLLTACGFFDKDNTPQPSPLPQYKPVTTEKRLWSSTEIGFGSGPDHLRIGPAIDADTIYVASNKGLVTAIHLTNGAKKWQIQTGTMLSTTPGTNGQTLVIGNQQGEVIAVNQQNGKIRWKSNVDGEVLAAPTVLDDKVLIKTINGEVKALSLADGHEIWSYQEAEPTLILRGASAPLVLDHSAIVGFASGNLVKLNLQNGRAVWTQAIAVPDGAFAITRMIDIDADPILYQHQLYAATYQGKIASLDLGTGAINWSRSISSYTGMVADNDTVYISDANSDLFAFNAATGETKWHQTKLRYRLITAPALMDGYLVVGDQEGYLHWINKHTGEFAANTRVGPMNTAPIVQNHVLYALTTEGYLAAYTITSPLLN
ncbi:MAG: outer membrane protein assembly factor BamB [Gammaproteobacteria bacterium RIFCSPHIGHO2_12_FULL_38_14]|nr:MAG: outer membrane protein assembly factor BamB [Gammaproteobacteria bacterium RIFCSPHIGHO2_12_FULL_38_14]